MNRNGVGCWNTEKPFTTENNALVFSDPKFEFPNDLKVRNYGLVIFWGARMKEPRRVIYQIFVV